MGFLRLIVLILEIVILFQVLNVMNSQVSIVRGIYFPKHMLLLKTHVKPFMTVELNPLILEGISQC